MLFQLQKKTLITEWGGGGGMGLLSTAAQRFGIAGELLSFFVRNRRWWLLPVVCVVLISAVVILLTQSSALAPFIYTLF
jgi:hypothetical protein